MSLKFFFNRKGKVVTTLFILGWGLTLVNLYHLPASFTQRGALTGGAFLLVTFLALLITLCRFMPWYRPEDRGAGIEEHFEKTFVPTGYILVVTNLIYIFWKSPWLFLIFVFLLFSVIQSVNFILIYFHFKDHDPTPPSYFARSLYKRDL